MINKIRSLFFFLKKRRIVAQYKLFFDDDWLELSIDSIAPYMYKILLVISDTAWGGNPNIKGDDFSEIVKRLKIKYPNKIIVLNGSWITQMEHVNTGLKYIKNKIPEATHCMYIDSDEIYTKENIEKLVSYTKDYKYLNTAFKLYYNTYFKSIYYKVVSEDEPASMVLFPVRSFTKYIGERDVNCALLYVEDCIFEHFSYVRKTDDFIKDKIEASRDTEDIKGDWYNDVWINWTPETINFHPVVPRFFKKTIRIPLNYLPEGIVEVYEKWNKKL